jgi:hypothetical protein
MSSATAKRMAPRTGYEPDHKPTLSPLPNRGPREATDDGVTYGELDVVPDFAAEVLDTRNRNPRKLRKDKAAQYAADMVAGKWSVGMSIVAFDPEGWLVDGQHRFAGCVMAGVPFRTLVAYGVSQEAVDNADRGFRRTVADILKGKGEANVTVLQATLSMCCKWDTTSILSNFVPTWSQLEQYLLENPDVREAVSKVQMLVKPPLTIRGSVAAPFAFRARRIDTEAADAFINQTHTGVGLQENDPVLRLREQFLGRRSMTYGRPSREHDLALTIKAWNAYIVGRPLRQLKWNRGGIRQEPFPYLFGSDGTPWPFPDYLRAEARRRDEEAAQKDGSSDFADTED